MIGVNIRPLEPSDLDGFYDVMEVVAEEGRWIGTEAPIDRERLRKQALEGLAANATYFFLAEVEGRIVGAQGLHREGRGLYDTGMFLLPEFRGRGIGSALMERSIALARELGAHKLTLQVWPHNERALRLYERFGFEREGYFKKHWRRRNGELWDSIAMGLVLD